MFAIHDIQIVSRALSRFVLGNGARWYSSERKALFLTTESYLLSNIFQTTMVWGEGRNRDVSGLRIFDLASSHGD
jgi:hypothetical protein